MRNTEEKKPIFIKPDKHKRLKQRALDKDSILFDVTDEALELGLRALRIRDIKKHRINNECSKNDNKDQAWWQNRIQS